MQIYEEEKMKLYGLLDHLSCYVGLITDMWTSIRNKGYFSYNGYFIHDEWKLQKRVSNFCVVD